MNLEVLHIQKRLAAIGRGWRHKLRVAAAVGHIDARHRIDQHPRIIVLRFVKDVIDRAGFHDGAAAHHLYLVRKSCDHTHIVRNQNDRGFQLVLQVAHDFQNLRLYRDVQRGGGLVGNQKIGAADRRHRDHHALAHAAGQFMGILLQPLAAFGNAHQFEYFDSTAFGLVARQAAVQAQGFDQLRADGQVRGERGQRVLKDHGDLGTAQFVDRLFRRVENFPAAIFHAACGPAIAGQQSRRRQEHLALAGAGFAHHPQALPFGDGEARALHRMNFAVMGGKPHIEVGDFQNRRWRNGRGHFSGPSGPARREARRR